MANITVTPLPTGMNLHSNGSGGEPLPAAVRQKMEAAFGTSFADVRIHVSPQAASIGALAFTQGNNLYFAPGQYSPHSAQGQRLLAYELTHVVQQRAGRVRSPSGSGVAIVHNAALEAEAERMARRTSMTSAPVQAKFMPAQHGLVAYKPQQPALARPALLMNHMAVKTIQRAAASQNWWQCAQHGRFSAWSGDAGARCNRCNTFTSTRAQDPGAAAAALAQAPAPAEQKEQAPTGKKKKKKKERLSSEIYVLGEGGWGRALGSGDADMGETHAEQSLYNTHGASQAKDTWIGFVQNAWPCRTAGRRHCTAFFTTKSANHNFVFNCTGDHGDYASEHGKKGTGTVYFYNRNVYYEKAKVPEAAKAPDPPAG